MGSVYYILVFAALILMTLSVLGGMWWAMRRGQMNRVGRGAYVIFDEDEPVGEMTDAFPGEPARTSEGTPKE